MQRWAKHLKLELIIYWESFIRHRSVKVEDQKCLKMGLSCLTNLLNRLKKIFNTLPKRLEWKSFYHHDLPLITDICDEIRKISFENQLNKA